MTLKLKIGRLRLAFWLPLRAIKGRIGQRMLNFLNKGGSNSGKSGDTTVLQAEAQSTAQTALPDVPGQTEQIAVTKAMHELYRAVKTYVKQNGHFTLLEIDAPQDDTKIKIKV